MYASKCRHGKSCRAFTSFTTHVKVGNNRLQENNDQCAVCVSFPLIQLGRFMSAKPFNISLRSILKSLFLELGCCKILWSFIFEYAVQKCCQTGHFWTTTTNHFQRSLYWKSYDFGYFRKQKLHCICMQMIESQNPPKKLYVDGVVTSR